jgi:thioesterase domain-containing protein
MKTEYDSFSGVSLEDLRALLAEQLLAESGPATLPLSCAQRQLWFLEQLEPNSPRYNIPAVTWLGGSLEVASLETALKQVVTRHESLRAQFINQDGEPALIVAADEEFVLHRHDLEGIAAGERDGEAKRLIEAEVQRPFDLSVEIPIRATLLRLHDTEHILIINVHHIVSDEWSVKRFDRELQSAYTSLVNGSAPSLPELPIQYSDYAAWQQDWMQSDDFREQLKFWKQHLAGNPPAVKLPTDRPRRGAHSKGALEIRYLPPEFRESLHRLAARQRATPFMLLLAALKALLHRTTEQKDIVVGCPIACRTHAETENVIGFFANTLPLRTQVSRDLTFDQLLARVREGILGAFSNQDVPFEKIVEALQPERAPGQTPFISILFLYQNDLEFLELPELQTVVLDLGTNTAKFDVTVFLAETDEALVLGMEYDSDLFAAATIRQWLRDYEQILRGIAEDTGKQLGDVFRFDARKADGEPDDWIPETAAAQRWQLLDRWLDLRAKKHREAPASNGQRKAERFQAAETDSRSPAGRDEPTVKSNGRTGRGTFPVSERPLASTGDAVSAVDHLEPELQEILNDVLKAAASYDHPTVSDLADLLREKSSSPETSIVEIQPEGSRAPLFLVHGLGGGMFWGYSKLSRQLGLDRPVFGFKSRTMDGKEELDTIEELARAYVADLRAVRPRGPYCLGGYCFGGVVAFEMSQQLQAQGEEVEFLGLINSTAPNSSYTEFEWSLPSALWFAVNVAQRTYYSLRSHPDTLPAFVKWKLQAILKRNRRVAGVPEQEKQIEDGWMDLSQYNEDERRVWRKHLQALCDYYPRKYPGRVLLFRSPVHLLKCSFGSDYGWRELADGGVTTRVIRCAHESILDDQGVGKLARAMQQYLP